MQSSASVYLIPSFLSEDAKSSIPPYVMDGVRNCQVIFAEHERTVRRYLKAMDSSIQIDAYEWHKLHPDNPDYLGAFRQCLQAGKQIAIISEAGCPGIADPGQELVAVAHTMHAKVLPLVGPSSILLALMGSGLNGQHFEFIGYLPIKPEERIKKIREIDSRIQKIGITSMFIETPYRNQPLLESLLQNTLAETKLCLATDLTGKNESIQTKTVQEWKQNKPELPKMPTIFLLGK
jgi:16S rRNA (cytidine1402-2'-O)-methyltransferase